jgi:hypothetical protein
VRGIEGISKTGQLSEYCVRIHQQAAASSGGMSCGAVRGCERRMNVPT